MTNKEALQFIIDTFNQYANKPDDIGLFFKFCDAHKQLKEALELLEILKKSIKETGISKDDGTVILKWEMFDIKEQKTFKLFNITIKNEEDFNKVKEWLIK